MTKRKTARPETVGQYIQLFPKETQKRLRAIRAIVKKHAPQAREKLSYGMPYYEWNGRLLYFAAYASHVGFYPMASGIQKFKSELKTYKWAKGSVQFPHNKPLPVSLVTKMVRYRVKENGVK